MPFYRIKSVRINRQIGMHLISKTISLAVGQKKEVKNIHGHCQLLLNEPNKLIFKEFDM